MPKLNIGQTKYNQIMEKYLAKGKSTERAHKIASSPLMHKPDKVDKPSIGDKIILALLKRRKKRKNAKNS